MGDGVSKMFRRSFEYGLWANSKIFNWAEPLGDDLLDQKFDMGPGSIRETLRHSYWAAAIWYRRIGGGGIERVDSGDSLRNVAEIRQAAGVLHQCCDEWLSGLSDEAFDQVISFHDTKGNPYENKLGDILFHVCNHGTHHRAQALNMLRQVGVEIQSIDYIYFLRGGRENS